MSEPLPQKKSLIEYALEYAALGWPVLPLHFIDSSGKCSCGDKDCKSPGKHPATFNGVKNATTNPAIIKRFFEDRRYNIGLAMREPHHTVDIDPRNGGDETWSKLISEHGDPETVIANTGGGGLHYIFKVPSNKQLIKFGKGIDVKKEGGYIVVEPSNHHTGGAYEWEGAFDPLDGCEVAEAPEWMLEEKGLTSTMSLAVKNGQVVLPMEVIADLRSALCYISSDEYDWWIRVGQALHSTQAMQSFSIWDEWSQKSDAYNPQVMRQKWSSFGASRGLNYESIFVWATEHGWPNPAIYKSEADEELKALVEKANKTVKYESVGKKDPVYRALPIAELSSLENWINDQMPVYSQQATQAAVLGLAASLASRKYESVDGDPSHLYLCVVSDSIGDIRRVKALSQRFLASCGKRDIIRSSRLSSATLIYKSLFKSPVMNYIADDYGQMLAFSRRQPSGIVEQALNTLTDAYSQKEIYIDQDIDPMFKDVPCPTVYQPCVNLLAMISEYQLPVLTSSSEIARGALEQFIPIYANDVITNEKVKNRANVPADVQKKVELLNSPATAGNVAHLDIDNTIPSVRHVEISDDAKNIIAEYDRLFMQLVNDHGKNFVSLATGARTNLRRLCVTLASWNAPTDPEINVKIVDWCGLYIKERLEWMLYAIDIHSSDDGKQDVRQKVTESIAKSGPHGVTMRDLVRNVRAFGRLNSEQRDELIEMMKTDDLIVQSETVAKNNKPKIVYIYKKFVKEVSTSEDANNE